MSAANSLPDFIVIGAAKSGTTTLFRYLCLHPRVFMSTPKEPCFFDEKGSRGSGIDWYRGLFAAARGDQVLGEASTNYTRFPQVPDVPRKIRALVPEVKLIYLMRDPVRRTYSHFVHRWSKETHAGEPFTMPFREYVEQDRMCIDGSDYALQLERYLEVFERERLLLLTFDEFHADRIAALRKMGAFLGLEGMEKFASANLHEGDSGEHLVNRWRSSVTDGLWASSPVLRRARLLVPQRLRRWIWERLPQMPFLRSSFAAHQPPPLSAEDRAWLAAYFAPRNQELARRHGVDIGNWERP